MGDLAPAAAPRKADHSHVPVLLVSGVLAPAVSTWTSVAIPHSTIVDQAHNV